MLFHDRLTIRSHGLHDCFCADNGRPSCPVRLMVALHYLKYASGMSDEAVLDEWLENPYWQYFTGGTYFEHDYPTDQSTMSHWRKRLAKSGAEKMLEESLKTGLREGFIKKAELNRRRCFYSMGMHKIIFCSKTSLFRCIL